MPWAGRAAPMQAGKALLRDADQTPTFIQPLDRSLAKYLIYLEATPGIEPG
jgi:hypothetical protein